MSERETSDSDSDIPWRSPRLQVILASSLIGVMGVSLLSPVLPALRSTFAITDAQVGLIITVYTFPGIVLTPFVGLAADRIGRRRTLVPLLLLFGIAGASIALTETFRQVLILRFVQGIGASALVTLAITLAGDYYEGRRQRAVIGLNSSALGTGAAIYPLIGGVLAGVRWELPFVFFGVSIFVGLAAFVVIDDQQSRTVESLRTYTDRIRDVATEPRAFGIYLAAFSTFFLYYGGVLTALPLLLADQYGVVEPYLGLILAVVSITNAFVAAFYGRIQAVTSLGSLIAIGFSLFGVALLAVRVAASPAHIAALLVIYGVGFGVVMPSLNSAVVAIASADHRASMLGIQTSMLRVGQTLGPIVFPGLAQVAFPTTVIGYRTVLPAFGAVSLLIGIGTIVVSTVKGLSVAGER